MVQVMIQNFYYYYLGGGGGGVSLSPPRLNIFTVGNMGVMICLGQGGLCTLWVLLVEDATKGQSDVNHWIQIYMQAYTCSFESPTFMLFHERKKKSYFMQSVLVLFCLKKMPWSYNSFSGKQKKSSPIAYNQHT